MDLKHTTGQARFLADPLLGGTHTWYQGLADAVLEGAQDLSQAMVDQAENLATASGRVTPVDYNNLRRSQQVTVHDAGRQVYSRGPAIPRLSEAELEELRRARSAGGRPRNVRGH